MTRHVLNISLPANFRKKWEIYAADVDIASGTEKLSLVDILEIAAETYDKANLVIPPLKLTYGTYKLKFYSR